MENSDGITLLGDNGIVKNNLSSQNSITGIYCNKIESYSIYYNTCLSNQNGILIKGSNDNLIILNDFDSNTSSNVVSTVSINSWESPLEIWYGYDRGTRNPPYVRSHMGNYYSDNGLSNIGEDGICDTAYALPGTEPEDDFPLYEATVNYGQDVNCDWDAEITSSENLLVLGALTIVGSLEIEGKLTLGGI
jgi:nitrous oxidase accessory protein NosD